jgi:Tfp pilus assembly protein PilN
MVRRINLVPQSERQRTTTDVGLLIILGAIIVAVFGLGFGYYLLNNSLSDRENELADLQQQTALLEGQLTALQQYERLQSERAITEAVVQRIYASRTLASDILNAVSLVVPDNVWFQSFSLTTADPLASATGGATAPAGTVAPSDNKLAINGKTYTIEDLAQVLVRLQLVPALSGVELASARQPEKDPKDLTKDVTEFSIGASVLSNQPVDTPLPMSQVEVEAP